MPIKFEIYRQGARLTAFEPVAAAAIGPESVPIPGEVAFRDGLLVVNRKDEHPVGVSLMWDCGGIGTFHVETTRLQPRDKPYNLNVELARFRLMRIMQKQEDWNLFDFPKTEQYQKKFHDATMMFADALGKLDDPAAASKLADRSLEMGVELSEQLALFHSELLINRRRAGTTFVKHIFGVRVDPTVQNEKYKETVAGNFDYAILPMSWKQLQPQEQTFITGPLDEWVELLSKRRVPTIAGPLVRLDEGQVPD